MVNRIEHLSDGVTLYLGDCREILPTLPKVDAVVTDPPYGLGESNRKKHMSRGQLAKPRDYGDYSWDEAPADQALIDMCLNAAKWKIIFGGNYFTLPPSSCWLVWDKMNCGNDFADCELAWTNLPKAVRKISWLWNGMIRAEKGARVHPTQKPREVMRWAITQLPTDCLTILDPFMGSGTTGVAAVSLDRKFIGIEISPKYFDIACRRIAEELRAPRLPVPEPKPKLEQPEMLWLTTGMENS